MKNLKIIFASLMVIGFIVIANIQSPMYACIRDGYLCSHGFDCCSGNCQLRYGAGLICVEAPEPTPPGPCPGQKICGNDAQGFIVCCFDCESEGCRNRLQRPTPTPLCPDQKVCGYVQGFIVCCFDCESEGCRNQLRGPTPTPEPTPRTWFGGDTVPADIRSDD